MECKSGWQDVFLTTDEYGGYIPEASTRMHDSFVAPVMSVEVKEKHGSPNEIEAKPATKGTSWLMLAFPGDASTAEVERWRSLRVGDMIRVGTSDVGGFTDYLRVRKLIDATRLSNATSGNWQIATLDPDQGLATLAVNTPGVNGYDAAGNPLTHIGSGGYAVEHSPGGLPGGSLRCVCVDYTHTGHIMTVLVEPLAPCPPA